MQTKTPTEQEAYLKLSARCAVAEYCIADMRRKMTTWGMEADVQQRIIEKLIDERFIDESRYAHAYVRDKSRYNKWGSNRIRQELRMRRIADCLIDEALSEEIDEGDTLETLRHLIEQKRPTVKGKSDYEIRAKLIRFALGRGYDYDTISRVISIDEM